MNSIPRSILRTRRLPKTIGGVILLIVVTLLRAFHGEVDSPSGKHAERTTHDTRSTPSAEPLPRTSSEQSTTSDDARIEQAFERQEHEVPVHVTAKVKKLLSDDDESPRHQRFLIELSSGRTLLVAHNIDLAKRVPVRSGTRVEVAGLYEWNAEGGVLHWTHADPEARHPGGYVKFDGTTYR